MNASASPELSRTDFATLGAAVARHAELDASRPALLDAGARGTTFSELSLAIRAFARELAAAGLGPDDRVGLLVPAGRAGAQLVVGLASNCTLVPLNAQLTAAELVELARLNGLSAIVFPQWLDSPSRERMEAEPIAILEACLDAHGQAALKASGAAPRRAGAGCRGPLQRDAALLLRSSGTTGAPKLIPVTHGNLLAMAERLASARWFALGPQDRVACTLPLHYAAGIKTSLLVPLVLGQTIVFPAPANVLDIGEWVDVLKPTYLSVAPAQLNAMVDRLKAGARRFDGRSLRFIMCAASYLPERVRASAESVLRVPVLEFYGLSEAGVMAANPAPPGRAKPGTVGLPAVGELLVVDEDRRQVKGGCVGQIMISGPTLTPGYVEADASGGAAFSDGWLLTGDLGRIDGDGYLSIVGRLKEVINRGGEKVFPYEIEKALLRHPGVLEAAAFGVPHPRLGESVAAAVVLKPGHALDERAIKGFLAHSLAAFKVPRRVHVVDRLPRGSTGKVLRSALTADYAALGGEAPARHEHLLEHELRGIWKRLLATDAFGLDDDFLDKGGDSLLAIEMLLEVERLTGRPYPRSDLSTLTIRRIYEIVRSGLAEERALVTQVKEGPGTPLFFCHGDSLTRGIYAQKLAALLPPDQPVFLLHCRPDRSVGSSIEAIAHRYLDEVLRATARSAVSVGGYCNGGLTAWHLAHLLQARGIEVRQVLLVDTLSLNARPDLRAAAAMLHIAGRVVPGRTGSVLGEKGMLAAWAWKRRQLAKAGGIRSAAARITAALSGRRPGKPDDGSDSAMRMYLELMARYVPPRIQADVTCFTAEDGARADVDPRYWRRLARRVSEVRLPGSHVGLIVSERPALAAAIARTLKQPPEDSCSMHPPPLMPPCSAGSTHISRRARS